MGLFPFVISDILKKNCTTSIKSESAQNCIFLSVHTYGSSEEVQQGLTFHDDFENSLYVDTVACVHAFDQHDTALYLYIVFPIVWSTPSTAVEHRTFVLLLPPSDQKKEVKLQHTIKM